MKILKQKLFLFNSSNRTTPNKELTVNRLSNNPLQLKNSCVCGGGCPRCKKDEILLQPRLKISQPNKIYEQEADEMAEKIMLMRIPQGADTYYNQANKIQRKETEIQATKTYVPAIISEDKMEGKILLAHEFSHVIVENTVQGNSNIFRKGEEDVDGNTESSNWTELVDDFTEYILSMAEVNVRYPTFTRGKWSAQFQNLWSKAGAPGEKTDAELLALRNAFIQLQNLFVDQNTYAFESWINVINAYEAERNDLIASGFPEDQIALEILDEAFQNTQARVDFAGQFLVSEDLFVLHEILKNQSHISSAERIAERERKKREQMEDQFEEEQTSEGLSIPGLVWDVIGWDSPGEFAADVVLTVITGGLGKITKIVVKGGKAGKKLSRLKKLSKLRKLRKAKRLEKLVRGSTELVQSVKELFIKFDAPGYFDWINKNWRKTLRAYITDEFGEFLSQGNPAESKNILERLSKDSVGEYVSRLLNITSSKEKDQFKYSVIAFATRASKTGMRELNRYFIMNLKRRALSNVVYYSGRAGIGETKLSSKIIVDIAASTSGEMAQDFASNLLPGVPVSLIETSRKTIQTAISDWIKTKLF